MPKPLHIGIVACSAEGAALCYRTICAEGAAVLGPHAHPEVSLHGASLAEYVHCLERGDLPGVAGLMLESARKLAAAGADFLVCPDNTIHQAFSHVAPASPLPWLHIAEVVAAEAAARGYRRVGLMGTRWLVASDVYPDQLGLRGVECIRPTDSERDETSRIIMDELVYGVVKPQSVGCFQAVIRSLAAKGCEAVVLGCTEIPLIVDDRNAGLPTLDSTRLLARAALRRAVAGREAPSYVVTPDPSPSRRPCALPKPLSDSKGPSIMATGTVRLHRVLRASPERVYRAFLDPEALAKWLPPHGFTCKVHHLDARVGGTYRMSFTNFATGKGHSFGGEYRELVPSERIQYTDRFDDPNVPGEMRTTVSLTPVSCGTDLSVVQEGIPPAIPVELCYLGWQESLAQLAALVEPEIPD